MFMGDYLLYMKHVDIKFLLEADYDKVSDIVSNPEHNERTLEDILKDFSEKGGKVLGRGRSGIVLQHPKWKFVVKLFSQDSPYLSFVRFCLKNPRKSFPVFFDKPRRIIPNFKRHKYKEYLYIVKTEKLEPISKKEFLDLQYYIYYGGLEVERQPDESDEDFIKYSDAVSLRTNTETKVKEIEDRYPSIQDFLKDYNFLMRAGIKGAPDIIQSNIMKRSEGEFVLSDPFWEGETPYQTAARLTAAEIGYDDDDEYEHNPDKDMIKGGKKWKSPKPIKLAKIAKSVAQDHSPF